jgi:predicted enzyme related to lactoylglutathione lyase
MTVHKESARMAGLTHGQLCYLQIPALDIQKSAEFYATVFGWQIEPTGSGFESPGVIGQWIDSRGPATDTGRCSLARDHQRPGRQHHRHRPARPALKTP